MVSHMMLALLLLPPWPLLLLLLRAVTKDVLLGDLKGQLMAAIEKQDDTKVRQ